MKSVQISEYRSSDVIKIEKTHQYQAHRTGGWKGRLAALERAGSPFGM
ncbi:MAG TPA: hypothetical protein VFS97_00375 [Nitrososphaeraceae archaeon]|nr:hypothetical protein [Nitrososphaeraceae archaeon]